MVVDFCQKTVATADEDSYSETVLYMYNGKKCEVRLYVKHIGEEEQCSVYEVDSAVVDEVYNIINEHEILTWKEKYSREPLCGAEFVLKFRREDREYERVTTENMPENGLEIMLTVNRCLIKYAIEKN